SGKSGCTVDDSMAGCLAANDYGTLSHQGYSLAPAFVAELGWTAFFLIAILGATDTWANARLASMAIALALTLIHLISIPITNTSVNPARSTSQAIFVGGEYISQLWLFWLAPILGAIVGGLIYRFLLQKREDT